MKKIAKCLFGIGAVLLFGTAGMSDLGVAASGEVARQLLLSGALLGLGTILYFQGGIVRAKRRGAKIKTALPAESIAS
jgi:hypothetical protein